MKHLFAALALAGFIVGCSSTDEDMGASSAESSVTTGSETNSTFIHTNGSSISTNGTSNSTNAPSNGNSQSGSEPEGSR